MSTFIQSLYAITEICSDIIIIIKVNVKAFVNFETQMWPWLKGKVIGLRTDYIDLSSDYLQSKRDGHCSKTFWNNITFSIISVWPWMKVKVNIIDTWCILMSEAVTLLSLMMMTLIVFEESLTRDTHTHRLWVLYPNFFQSKTLKTKNKQTSNKHWVTWIRFIGDLCMLMNSPSGQQAD